MALFFFGDSGKILILFGLCDRTPDCWLQSIDSKLFIRKIFWNRELAAVRAASPRGNHRGHRGTQRTAKSPLLEKMCERWGRESGTWALADVSRWIFRRLTLPLSSSSSRLSQGWMSQRAEFFRRRAVEKLGSKVEPRGNGLRRQT